LVRPIWIAVEGLDGAGKSTTVAALVESLNAEVVTNPPASLIAERAEADQLPDAGKRAWYLHANRVAACQARGLVDAGSAVVMDRSVASTLVFGAAEQGRVALEGEWPHEIPRPDLLVLLDVQEEERRRRLMGRQGQLTAEEG